MTESSSSPRESASDVVVPFTFARLPVRGAIVQLGREWRSLVERQNQPSEVREVLGHAAAAVPLIAQSLKEGTSVTLQLTGGGPLSLLVMQCTNSLKFRGMATSSEAVNGLAFDALVTDARCAITIDSQGQEQSYQGIVAVSKRSLAASLENYFYRSAQLPSHVALVADETTCAGLLLQQMPGDIGLDEDDWRRLGFLAETLNLRDVRDGVGTELLRKLFPEDDLRVFEPRPAEFRCRCSRERAANVLRLLGPDECDLTADDEDQIVVTCEYCGRQQRFDPVDLAAIFAESNSPTSDQLH